MWAEDVERSCPASWPPGAVGPRVMRLAGHPSCPVTAGVSPANGGFINMWRRDLKKKADTRSALIERTAAPGSGRCRLRFLACGRFFLQQGLAAETNLAG